MASLLKTDNDLMHEFSSCSFKAYEEIVKRYKKRLHNFLLKGLIQDRDVSEDIVQKTLIKVYENKFNYKPTYQFSTWVYRISRNLALNEIRDSRKSQFESLSDENEPGDYSGNSLTMVEKDEMIGLMRRILNKLDIKYKEVLTMRFLEELSYEEIAKITGDSVNTLKSRCKRGLEKLRIEMEAKN